MMIKPLLSFFVIAMFSFHPITKACAQGMLDSKAPHPLSLEEVQMIKETAPHPMLNLRIEPMLSSRSLRKGFDILIHQDNQPWIELQDQGSRKIDTSVPMGHLYTLDVRHKDAHRKVFQIDTRGIRATRFLSSEVDLVVSGFQSCMTQEQELWLSMPLSVTYFDKERNLFSMNPYSHHKCMKETYERLSLK